MLTKNKTERYFKQSVSATEAGQRRRARKWLRIAQFYGYPKSQIHFQQGVIALEELNLIKAVQFFHSYLSVEKKLDPTIHYQLGVAYYLLGNKKEATLYFKKACEQSDSILVQCKTLIYLRKIGAYSPDKIAELAHEKSNYLLNIYATGLEQIRIDALLASLRGNHDQSITLLKDVIADHPNLREAYRELSECYLYDQRYDEYISFLKQRNSHIRKDKILALSLAKAYYYSNRFSFAKHEILTLVKDIPNNATLYFNLANIYYKLKQVNRAAKYYLKSTQCDSQFYLGYFNLGVLYHKVGLLDSSEKYYTKAQENHHLFSSVHYNLGIVHFQKKHYFDSLNAFSEADQLNVSDTRAKHNFNMIKNIKRIDPNIKVGYNLMTMTNLYLFITGSILLFLFLYFN